MSHELELDQNGNASFYSLRETPWHRLGTVVEEAHCLDDVLKIARLDWRVDLEPVRTFDVGPLGIPRVATSGDQFAAVRTSPLTGEREILGTMGERYRVVQTRDAAAFLDVLHDSGDAPYQTAGSMKGGRKVFISQKISREVLLDDGGAADGIDFYLMAYNSFDGKSAFTVAVTPVRPVCHNTVQFGLRQAKAVWTTRHTVNVTNRVSAAREVLGISFDYMDAFEREAEAMIRTELTRDVFESIISDVFPVSDDATDRVKANVADTRDAVRMLYEDARTNENIRGTAWAAYNAITEYLDWLRPSKGVGRMSSEAYERKLGDLATGGPVAQLRQRAYERVSVAVVA